MPHADKSFARASAASWLLIIGVATSARRRRNPGGRVVLARVGRTPTAMHFRYCGVAVSDPEAFCTVAEFNVRALLSLRL
jgi:hypothetical protein